MTRAKKKGPSARTAEAYGENTYRTNHTAASLAPIARQSNLRLRGLTLGRL